MARAECASGLDDDGNPIGSLRRLPRWRDPQALANGARGKRLLPCAGPGFLDEWRDLHRAAARTEPEGLQIRHVSLRRTHERGRRGAAGEERPEAERRGRIFLFDDAEGAQLPEKV